MFVLDIDVTLFYTIGIIYTTNNLKFGAFNYLLIFPPASVCFIEKRLKLNKKEKYLGMPWSENLLFLNRMSFFELTCPIERTLFKSIF